MYVLFIICPNLFLDTNQHTRIQCNSDTNQPSVGQTPQVKAPAHKTAPISDASRKSQATHISTSYKSRVPTTPSSGSIIC